MIHLPRTIPRIKPLQPCILHHLTRRRAHNATPCKKSTTTPPITSLPFWTHRQTWSRAGVNTLRCLIGCTSGDFSSLWLLQSFYPDLGMGVVMGISMTTGLLTSLTLETVLLTKGKDKMPWSQAFQTACGMSFISMLAMESVQNVVDYHLTGGVVDFADAGFWGAAVVSMGAGFLAPLPWNYTRLRAWGKSCH
ncbi:hypothetical protein BDV25DRAFT_163931 [Aspergillus avenaceus]|uniref:DUF4396 domain-containing protein n=1 Tax=Aspergillus avenaceus TaxID=36643 RepID=A0A5N6TH93_ASPAV|nr:hypothetical protein BDV25DRAFT_163931 [Aspergillus avenaceus]